METNKESHKRQRVRESHTERNLARGIPQELDSSMSVVPKFNNMCSSQSIKLFCNYCQKETLFTRTKFSTGYVSNVGSRYVKTLWVCSKCQKPLDKKEHIGRCIEKTIQRPIDNFTEDIQPIQEFVEEFKKDKSARISWERSWKSKIIHYDDRYALLIAWIVTLIAFVMILARVFLS